MKNVFGFFARHSGALGALVLFVVARALNAPAIVVGGLATLFLGLVFDVRRSFATMTWRALTRALVPLALATVATLVCIHYGGDVAISAVSSVTILGGSNTFIADVTATADADTTATLTHGLSLGGTPKEVQATKILSNALAAEPGWSWAAPGATTVVGTKLATAGSGNAAAQQRVTVRTPHSLGA